MPKGWAWCRLKQLSLDMADGPFGSNLKAEHYTKNKEARIIQLSNIGEYGWREENTKFTTLEHAKNNISRSIVEPGNLVIAKMMPAGKAIICPNNEKMYVLSSDAVKLVPTSLINSNYLLNSINSPFFRASVTDNVQGTTRLRTSISKLRECFFPLPPFAEQERIVSSIERIFAQINNLEESKSNLESVIKQTKSKILDLAIHGKLVPQDPNDEPAEELLKRIATSDNRPYEKVELSEIDWTLPNNWCFCHFWDIAIVINGKNQSKVENPNGKYPIYGSGGIIGRADDYICPENCTIIGRKGSINNPILVEEKFWNVDTAFGLSPSEAVLPRFLFYFCEYFDFTTLDSSTTLPSLTKTNIQQIIFALPPIEEQKRILDKTNELFGKLDEIVLNLI